MTLIFLCRCDFSHSKTPFVYASAWEIIKRRGRWVEKEQAGLSCRIFTCLDIFIYFQFDETRWSVSVALWRGTHLRASGFESTGNARGPGQHQGAAAEQNWAACDKKPECPERFDLLASLLWAGRWSISGDGSHLIDVYMCGSREECGQHSIYALVSVSVEFFGGTSDKFDKNRLTWLWIGVFACVLFLHNERVSGCITDSHFPPILGEIQWPLRMAC